MGCLGYNQEELLDRKNLSQLGKILNHSDDQIMKHLTISLWSLKPRFDELRKINEENLKFRPFLDAKIKELCEKRENSKPVVIARGNCCKNPCYAYMKKITESCPECQGKVEVGVENGIRLEDQWDNVSREIKKIEVYNDNVCDKFTFNENIDKIDYDLEEFFKYFTKVDPSEKFPYYINFNFRGQKTEYSKELERRYMIVDGKRFNAPYGISLADYFRINDSFFFFKTNQDVSFFYEGNIKELGQSVGYYGLEFKHFVFIYTCNLCGLKYHILRTSPFAFRDKSKDNTITE